MDRGTFLPSAWQARRDTATSDLATHRVDEEGCYLRERFIEVNQSISKERRSQLSNDFSYRRGRDTCVTLLRSSVELLMDLHQGILHNVHRVVIDDPPHCFKHYASPIPLVSTFLPPLRLISYVFTLQRFVTFQKRPPEAELRNVQNDGSVLPDLHRVIDDHA